MLLADAQESDVLEREALDRAIPTVEGIVLASRRMSDSAIRMTAKQRPMIVLNRAVADVPSLVTDNPHGVRRAAEHFAGLGHRTITYVAGPDASWADGIRWRSLREVADDLGLHTRRAALPADRPRRRTGGDRLCAPRRHRPSSRTTTRWPSDHPRADRPRASVPDDVSIIGFDNIFAADLVTPRLTTVAAPLRALGGTAVHNLLAIINGARSRATEPIALPTRLIERASTARRPRRKPPTAKD